MSKPLAFIIEDDRQLNYIFGLTLKADFEIHSITDGDQAIKELAEASPALVVLDMNLPGASGREVLTYIRGQKRLGRTRVIMATADALQADLLEDEVDLVLLKPVSPAQLRELALRMKINKQKYSGEFKNGKRI
ncbi:MAG: response regulator [Anaerolineae bacterium]|nr:response regulator [Anaerolineae bacterium]